MNPGECFWVKTEGNEEATSISLHYIVPLMGFASVWFKDPVALFGEGLPKQNWQVPISTLISIAKVSHYYLQTSCF